MKRNPIRLTGAAVCVCLISLASCGKSNAPSTGGDSSKSTVPLDSRCVLPSPETIESGKYTPLSRPLFIYVNKKALKRPEVAAFVQFYLNEGQEIVPEVGYMKLAAPILVESKQALASTGAGKNSAAKISGKIIVDGSSTVYLISQAVAEEFQKDHKEVKVEVGRSGTGGGFKKFAVGETDITGASRAIDKAEIAKCEESKIEYVELKVAIDGLSVVVNSANDWCHCLTVEQLQSLWKPDSNVTKWSDLDPKWPAQEIRLYGADTDSGTFDFFTEAIVGKAKSSRSDYTASGDDNVLVVGVEGDKYSLGYIPYAYYAENKDKLKVLGIIPRENGK